jgi:hypothetical protein
MGLIIRIGGIFMSPKRKLGSRPGKCHALVCGIVGSDKILFKNAFRRIFKRIGEKIQNELKLNPENSLGKNKKRIKLNHEKLQKNKKRIVAKNEEKKIFQPRTGKNFLSPFYNTNPFFRDLPRLRYWFNPIVLRLFNLTLIDYNGVLFSSTQHVKEPYKQEVTDGTTRRKSSSGNRCQP